jgi:ribonuclease HI
MDYAAIVWHRPTKHERPPASLSKLETAQRTAMKAILGAFRTTTTSSMEIDTSLLPAHLRLREKILQSMTRMQTAQEKHPIHQTITRATNSTSGRHISTLEYLTRSFPELVKPLEIIKPYARPPWWTPPFETEIATNKKVAKQAHDQILHERNTLCIYTDGSGIDGHVGAAAFCPTTSDTRKVYLGTEEQFNVFTAEVIAFDLAAEIAKASPPNFTKCIIYADSQAAIKGIVKPQKQSGQSIIISAIDNIESLQSQRTMTIKITWIPGHRDIHGNETVDKHAKEAAKSKGNSGHVPTTAHKSLKSSRLNTIKQAIDNDWDVAWKAVKNDAKQLRRITSKRHTQKGIKLYKAINTRHDVAQLARLRTGHCSLNQYLFRFGHADSPYCDCDNQTIETVQHYLLQCPRYEIQRARLVTKVGIGGMWIEKLLGYPELIEHTLEYVKKTKRFKF